jgi:hypothetical protein
VEPAVAEHLEQDGVLPGRPRHSDAKVGLVLPQPEAATAVLEHRRARLLRIEPPDLHLADVGHDVGVDSSRLLHEVQELPEKLVVSHSLQAQHRDSLEEITLLTCSDPMLVSCQARSAARDHPSALHGGPRVACQECRHSPGSAD